MQPSGVYANVEKRLIFGKQRTSLRLKGTWDAGSVPEGLGDRVVREHNEADESDEEEDVVEAVEGPEGANFPEFDYSVRS